ncbi:hypothetical protein ASG50_24585 [Rhizobium sp. Leaf386]|nr:hypothetical protein ASG50_24585 [Rhizobium sp. Leaf386]
MNCWQALVALAVHKSQKTLNITASLRQLSKPEVGSLLTPTVVGEHIPIVWIEYFTRWPVEIDATLRRQGCVCSLRWFRSFPIYSLADGMLGSRLRNDRLTLLFTSSGHQFW